MAGGGRHDHAARHGEAMGPLGVAKAAGISEASLPDQVKALYERAKISVRGGSSTYRFVDGRGEAITEQAFARRYRDLTGSPELDEFDYRHDTTRLWVSGGLTGASLLAMLAAAFTLTRSCTPEDVASDENPRVLFLRPEGTGCTKADPATGAPTFDPAGTTGNPLGAGLVVFGGFAAIGFGAWFVYELLSGDSATSHALSDSDAMLFAERYNRSLLRRTITDVERSRRSGRTRTPGLRLGLTAQGLRATF